MPDQKAAPAAKEGATPMPVLLATLIPALLQAGVQLAPLVAGLINFQDQIQQPNRPDISDADRAALRGFIVGLQASIDAAALAAQPAAAPAAPAAPTA